MINSKELDFNHELGNINEHPDSQEDNSNSDDDQQLPDFLDSSKSAANKNKFDSTVFEVDCETLVQNVPSPYLFITFKPYADRSQILKGDLSALTQQSKSIAPGIQAGPGTQNKKA